MGKTLETKQFEEEAKVFSELYDGYVEYQRVNNPKSLIMTFSDFTEIVAHHGIEICKKMSISEFLMKTEFGRR